MAADCLPGEALNPARTQGTAFADRLGIAAITGLVDSVTKWFVSNAIVMVDFWLAAIPAIFVRSSLSSYLND